MQSHHDVPGRSTGAGQTSRNQIRTEVRHVLGGEASKDVGCFFLFVCLFIWFGLGFGLGLQGQFTSLLCTARYLVFLSMTNKSV